MLYTYEEAKENLHMLMKHAEQSGAVAIMRKDRCVFELRPRGYGSIPPNMKPVDLGMTTEEIVELIRELRGGPLPEKYEPDAE